MDGREQATRAVDRQGAGGVGHAHPCRRAFDGRSRARLRSQGRPHSRLEESISKGSRSSIEAPPKPKRPAPVPSLATPTSGPSLSRKGRFYPEADFTIEERANAVAELLLEGLKRLAAGKA